ncbi:acyl-CoA dehydrogenase, middle domain protein 11 [Achromobacter xylosoxidans A8]|uniref:Acyl-CoA dehydrogenase, middle domain protein 11 n=1 Tax=Achromobacter xylosoxidans (strain A8) TaxID=762376 RepID=E3HQ41_ACHXA|nr:acyl-CoA dehydrogenase family protein [Achromobacter xylosoxidans]ADP17199.1 acyl-CoA dehydrogenase, middle domain protein 11 [Achromobacter xylosoxidans A8]
MSTTPLSTDLETFRTEVRLALEGLLPQDIRAAVQAQCLVTREQAQRWHGILHARGWGAPGWPREHGGPGWSLAQQAVFREELAASEAPRYENLGIDTIGPTIMRHGTPQQCATFLPRILSFEDFWAQGYSEPDAGSDLASLRTVTRREGDHYVLNGTKIWQSYGHWANWVLVLARSDAAAQRKQDGISVLLVDMTAPGVTVRPIRFMHGGVLHVQIFFDDVRVPLANLVGAEHAGWSVAKGLLVTERLFVARVAETKAELQATRRLASGRGPGGASLLEQDVYARRYAELDIRARALDASWWPAVAAVERGEEPALAASLLKLQGNEVLQDTHQLQLDLLGGDALAFDPAAVAGAPSDPPLSPRHAGNLSMHVWRYRGITLGGGTSEIQRGIVAKAIFGGQTEIDMPQALPEQQAMLDDGLRRLLADTYDFDRRRAMLEAAATQAPSFWAGYGELGLRGLMVPERDDGFGGGLSDLVPVMEALGEFLVLDPVLWSHLLPLQLLLDAPGYAGRAAAIAALVDGHPIAFAHGERGAPLTARRDGDGWRLSGVKTQVLGGDSARRALASARLEGGGSALFDCPMGTSGIQVRAYRLHDGRGAADLTFDDLRLPASARVAGPERADGIIDEALAFTTIALCAETVGAMRQALALTIEYMRTRKQFGRNLAENQALQHRVVEHYRNWIHARALLREAVAGWDTASPSERAIRVSAAKWMAGRAGRGIALDALQLHGAVGFQEETAISHYARRLAANDVLLGDAVFHLGRCAALNGPYA